MKYYLAFLVLFTIQMFHVSAQANLLPPMLTYYTSSSLAIAGTPEMRIFRVDRTAVNIHCQQNNCTVEAEYTISCSQPSETVLFFVLPRPVGIQALVNDSPVPVSLTSSLEPASSFFKWKDPSGRFILHHPPRIRSTALYYASFAAPISLGENTIRVHYEQPYNYDLYGTENGTIRQLRYEFWPLHGWYLADTFTMTVSAEFMETVSGQDELLVHYYENGLVSSLSSREPFTSSISIDLLEKQWKPSSSIERFTSSNSTISFAKQWKHNFPARIVWFVGDKRRIEVAKGFYLFR